MNVWTPLQALSVAMGVWPPAVRSRLVEALAAVLAVQAVAAAAVGLLHGAERGLRRVMPAVVSVAVGVLLGTGLAHLMPEAITALGNRAAVWTTLLGTIAALSAFERIFQALAGVSAEPVQPFEGHAHDCEELHGGHTHAHGASRPATLLVGAVAHSFVDGASVAVAFAVGPRVGWITALAIGLHEAPHRMGDFALLLHMGVERRRAAVLAIAAGAASVLGWGLVALLGAEGGRGAALVPWLLPISAGSFLYIALVDLLPEIATERRMGTVLVEIAALTAGLALAVGLTYLPGA